MPSNLAALRKSRVTDASLDWPKFGLIEDIRPALAGAQAAGRPSVLATLYRVQGGAPRGVGAQMLFTDETMEGFLSGGCIEADVALHAREVRSSGHPRHLIYGEGGPVDIRLPCGSRIDVFLEHITPNDVAAARLCALAALRRPAVWLSNGEVRICLQEGVGAEPPKPLSSLVEARKSGDVCGFNEEPFAIFRAHVPSTRLVVIGSDPITLATARLAVEMGLETSIVRPRGPEEPPLEGVQYFRSEVETALHDIVPDPWTAIAVLSHDKAQEQDALQAALTTSAGYVGALGSSRRVPERNKRLLDGGVEPGAISQIHTPIGLPIGGTSPWRIAIAVLAEILAEIG